MALGRQMGLEPGNTVEASIHPSLHPLLPGSAGSLLPARLQCAQGTSPSGLLLTSRSQFIPFALCPANDQRQLLGFPVMFSPLPTVLAVLRRGLQEFFLQRLSCG